MTPIMKAGRTEQETDIIRSQIEMLTDDIDSFDEAVQKCDVRNIVHFAREVGRSDSVLSKHDTAHIDGEEVAVIRQRLSGHYYQIGDHIPANVISKSKHIRGN